MFADKSGSIIEIMEILESVINTRNERLQQKFIPFKNLDILKKLNDGGFAQENQVFENIIFQFYEKGIVYLNRWLEPFREFSYFKWQVQKIDNIDDD